MNIKEKQREYRLKNKEKIKKLQKAYYLRNKDRIKEKTKLYKENNREYYKKYQEDYYYENIDKLRENSKNYYHSHKEECSQRSKIYRESHRNDLKEYKANYQKNNVERIKIKKAEYYQNNKNKVNAYNSNKRKNDPLFHLKWILRVRIRDAFRRSGYSKDSKTFELLGVEFEVVKKHIESQFTFGMCWEFVGPLIQIDHIIPLSSAKNKEELVKLCHYTNLQPLWMIDNLEKGSKILI